MENQDAFNAWYDNEVYSGRNPGRCPGMCYTVRSAQPEQIEALKAIIRQDSIIITPERDTEWISVEDGLPAISEPVLTYCDENGVVIGFRTPDERWRIPAVIYPSSPTHWMPLPKPPK